MTRLAHTDFFQPGPRHPQSLSALYTRPGPQAAPAPTPRVGSHVLTPRLHRQLQPQALQTLKPKTLDRYK